MQKSRLKIMDRSQVSRARLQMDCLFMLLCRVRQHLQRMEQASGHRRALHGTSRYLTWDSSPQFLRDYEIAVVRAIPRRLLPSLLRASYELHDMRLMRQPPAGQAMNAHTFSSREQRDREAALMAFIKASVRVHHMPPSLVGFGASTFARKLQAVAHGCRLEVQCCTCCFKHKLFPSCVHIA